MNAVTLLNELYLRNIALQVIGTDRLRFEATKDSITEDLMSYLREHKPEIIAILGVDRSSLQPAWWPLPILSCGRHEDRGNRKSELPYFDTRCVHCGEIRNIGFAFCRSAFSGSA